MTNIVLPPGFKFVPTDAELVRGYLLPKVTNNPLPVEGLIKECNLYGDIHPWDIFKANGSKKTQYFFTKLKKKGTKVVIRTVGDKKKDGGTWKLSAKGKDVKDKKGIIIGKKSSLSYVCEGKSGYNTEWGRWIMKEYALDGVLSGAALPKFKDFVLCRIMNKPDKKEKRNHESEDGVSGIQSGTANIEVDVQQQDGLYMKHNNGFAINYTNDNGGLVIQDCSKKTSGEALPVEQIFNNQELMMPPFKNDSFDALGCSVADFEDLSGFSLGDLEIPDFTNGLIETTGTFYADDKLESLYIPNDQEMQQYIDSFSAPNSFPDRDFGGSFSV